MVYTNGMMVAKSLGLRPKPQRFMRVRQMRMQRPVEGRPLCRPTHLTGDNFASAMLMAG